MKRLLFSLLLFLVSLAIRAQAPQALNYQAIARALDGNIVSRQSIGVRFSILDASTAGIVVYQETHQTITNNFGLFTLAIGKGTSVSGTFPGINWGIGSKFLKAEIALQGGINYQLQGTTQLLSVPYALYAEKGGTPGPIGPAGPTGLSILNGIISPTTIGVNGDFYINTTTNQLFGPKTNGLWGAGIGLVGATGPPGPQGPAGPAGAVGPMGLAGPTGPIGLTGATGPAGPIGVSGLTGPQGLPGAIGATGPQGTAGANGKTILNGTSTPASTIGNDGDFYINTATYQIYGPKIAGIWGTPVSLTGPAGPTGLKSLIDLENFLSSTACPLGGVIVKSGIDQNSNNILESTEVDNTKAICFTQSTALDKLIIIPIFLNISNTTYTNPIIHGTIAKFNKNNYPGVDSIILVTHLWSANSFNTAKVQLYNITDNITISNSSITTNSGMVPGNLQPFRESGNVFNFLPNHTIDLGIIFQGSAAGSGTTVGYSYLYLYRN